MNKTSISYFKGAVIMSRLLFPLSDKEAKEKGIKKNSDDNKNAIFPTILRELRADKSKAEGKEITQQIFADAIDVTKSTISLYENGDNVPDVKTIVKIADFYDVSYDYLLGKSKNKVREFTDIGAKLGLSDKAIQNMKFIYDFGIYSLRMNNISNTKVEKITNSLVLNALFEYDFINKLSTDIKDYLEYYSSLVIENEILKNDGENTNKFNEDYCKFKLFGIQQSLLKLIEKVVEEMYKKNKDYYVYLHEFKKEKRETDWINAILEVHKKAGESNGDSTQEG
jgi:transcriptional regulator with XRE-family HTH domain